jgi:hypothetical protein
MPQKFVFAFRDEEVAAFRKLVMKRLNRTLNWEGYWGVVFLLIFVLGLAVYGAYALGLFGLRSLEPVLVTAYVAFVAGAIAYAIGAKWQYREIVRAYYGADDKQEWEYSFNDTGMAWRSKTGETRIPWHTMRKIEDNGAMVLLWFDIGSRSTCIPARVFTSAAARAAFVAAVAAHIEAARGGSQT